MSDNIIIESGTIRLTDAIWAKARHRAGVISSIAEEKSVSKVIATEAAQKLELSERTVYRLVKRWRESCGSITSLVSIGSNCGKGSNRLQLIASF